MPSPCQLAFIATAVIGAVYIFRRECGACVRRVEVSRVHAESSSSLGESEKVRTKKESHDVSAFQSVPFFRR